MKVDVTCEDLFLVTYDETKVHLNYRKGVLVTLIFLSPEEASAFYNEHEFLNEDAYRYQKTISGILVKSIFVNKIFAE